MELTCQFLVYSEVPLIRPPMVFVESGLNNEQASLTRPIYIEKKMHFDTETCGLTSECGLNSEGGLNF